MTDILLLIVVALVQWYEGAKSWLECRRMDRKRHV